MRGDDLAGIIIPALVFLIPIIAILTRHQQKMTMLMRDRDQSAFSNQQQDSRLLHEIAQLRQLVAQQSIAIDDLSTQQRELSRKLDAEGEVRQRLTS